MHRTESTWCRQRAAKAHVNVVLLYLTRRKHENDARASMRNLPAWQAVVVVYLVGRHLQKCMESPSTRPGGTKVPAIETMLDSQFRNRRRVAQPSAFSRLPRADCVLILPCLCGSVCVMRAGRQRWASYPMLIAET